MTRITLLLIFIVRAAAAEELNSWPKEPTSFRGAQFGTTDVEVNGLGDRKCPEVVERRLCVTVFRLEEAVITEYLVFDDHKLYVIKLSFRSEDFDFLRDVFIERYGPPTKVEQHSVRTRLGVEYLNDDLTWEGTNLRILLSRYDDTVDKGRADFFTRRSLDKMAQEEAERRRKAAGVF